MHTPGWPARLRAAAAAWPALVFYAGSGLAAHAGEWTAAWLFFFSGSVLAVTFSRAAYARTAVRALPPTPGSLDLAGEPGEPQ